MYGSLVRVVYLPTSIFAPLALNLNRPSQFTRFCLCLDPFNLGDFSSVNLDLGFLQPGFGKLWSVGILFWWYNLWNRGSPIVLRKQGFLWATNSVHQLELENTLDQSWHYCFLWCVACMDYREAREFRRVLRRHEESIQCNRSFLFLVTSKVHENEHQCTSQNVIIIITLVQQRQKIDELKAECNMLRNMVVNLST